MLKDSSQSLTLESDAVFFLHLISLSFFFDDYPQRHKCFMFHNNYEVFFLLLRKSNWCSLSRVLNTLPYSLDYLFNVKRQILHFKQYFLPWALTFVHYSRYHSLFVPRRSCYHRFFAGTLVCSYFLHKVRSRFWIYLRVIFTFCRYFSASMK